MKTGRGTTVTVENSFTTRWSDETFPQMSCFAEGRDLTSEVLADEACANWRSYSWRDRLNQTAPMKRDDQAVYNKNGNRVKFELLFRDAYR